MDPDREAVQATARPPIRVVIADDHPMFRAGVRERLERAGTGIEVVAEASNGDEACRLTGETRPDVVLLDIAMPGMNGIEATKRIKASWPEVGVVILTVYDDEQYIYALIDAGAAGYLLKTAEGYELSDALHRVCQGEAVLAPAVTQKVLRRARYQSHAREDSSAALSAREHEVLRLAARGASNKSIALALHVSVRTVHAHMRHIFTKLGVASRTEAVMLAMRAGWLDVGDGD